MGGDEAPPPLCASTNGVLPVVLTLLPLDVLFPTLLLPFHLKLRQCCKASFPETLPPASI